jgi:hypothetical protein
MATRAETSAVYEAGLIQGITLVTFPDASFTLARPVPARRAAMPA